MKNLEKIKINSKKLLNNEELKTLRGGNEALPCGEDHQNYWCDISYGEIHVTGYACCHIFGELFDVIDELYPDNTGYWCEYRGGAFKVICRLRQYQLRF